MPIHRFSLATLAFSILAATGSMAAPPPAQISPRNFELRTAGELAVLCNTPSSDPGHSEAVGYCRGYIRGALAYHRAITPANAPRLFCPPSPMPPDAAMRSQFAVWVNSSPRNAAQAPVEGIFRFLTTTFPCPR